jgi:hypothetical protein
VVAQRAVIIPKQQGKPRVNNKWQVVIIPK